MKYSFFFLSMIAAVSCSQLLPPIPEIERKEMVDTSTLLNYSQKVQCLIRNKGGEGEIVMEVTVIQGPHKWEKLAKRFYKAGELANMEIDFPEVELKSDPISYEVKAHAK